MLFVKKNRIRAWICSKFNLRKIIVEKPIHNLYQNGTAYSLALKFWPHKKTTNHRVRRENTQPITNKFFAKFADPTTALFNIFNNLLAL